MLFLAVGVLEWVDPALGAAHKTYRAPILLIPVRLERPSMAEGVRMRRLDEETAFNPTLAEFLRSQFKLTVPGIDPLPTDESGLDVAKIFGIFRAAVRDLRGLCVSEDCMIGQFSFGKFVMWKDMTTRMDELRKNPLVDHLVKGGGLYEDGVKVFPPEAIGEKIVPGKVYCPLSADSSQMIAISESLKGKSFVLHGPPGTGKSQTITNIIANQLYRGKRVLFVAEKMAALQVVQHRLESIGLAPFCLELHSNKAKKSGVLEQLQRTTEVTRKQSNEAYKTQLEKIKKLRKTIIF